MKNYHNNIMINVIIPVYNCKKYLDAAVKSVLSQPYDNINIIIVDDGSTDGSGALCDKLADNNRRIVVIHQPNAGVSNARNTGLKYILNKKNIESWDYIAFLDADDVWMPDFYDDTVIDLLKKDYDLLGFQSLNCDKKIENCSPAYPLKEGVYMGNTNSIWIYSSQQFAAMLFNAGFVRKYCLEFSNVKYSEDKIFSMKSLYLANTICLYNKVLYLYRGNPSSAIHTRKKGIDYFGQFIKEYIQIDVDMEIWKVQLNKEQFGGAAIAKYYLMDMIEEHLQNGGKKSEIKCFFTEHPEYINLLEDKLIGNAEINIRWEKMKKYPIYVCLKNKIKGCAYFIVYKLSTLNFVRKCIEKKKYPMPLRR